MRLFALLFASLAAAALIACGGDDDDGVAVETGTATPVTTETPDQATPTPSPTEQEGSEPTPTPSVSLPEQPPDFLQWPSALEAYANDAGLTGCPADLLAAWGQAEGTCLEVDLNGDSLTDVVFSLENPAFAGQEIVIVGGPDPGVVLALVNTGDGFVTGYSATADGGRGLQPYPGPGSAPWIGTGDVDGDGVMEFAYLTVQCGAHTCNSTVHVVTSDGQQFIELPTVLEMSTLSFVEMGDFDAGPGDEIRATGGIVNSVGAGPQRERTEVRGLSGGSWEVRSLAYADSPYLYHRLRDADRLFEANLFEEAIAAYNAALEDASLEDWHALLTDGQETDRTVLEPYALLRRGIAEAALVEPSVEATMAEATALGTIFGEMADTFATLYLEGGDLPGACEAFRSTFAQADVDAALDYGYENPAPAVESICPF